MFFLQLWISHCGFFQKLSLTNVIPNSCSYKFCRIDKKHLGRTLFFYKGAELRAATSLKKRLRLKCFPMILQDSQEQTFLTKTPGGCFCFLRRIKNLNIVALAIKTSA